MPKYARKGRKYSRKSKKSKSYRKRGNSKRGKSNRTRHRQPRSQVVAMIGTPGTGTMSFFNVNKPGGKVSKQLKQNMTVPSYVHVQNSFRFTAGQGDQQYVDMIYLMGNADLIKVRDNVYANKIFGLGLGVGAANSNSSYFYIESITAEVNIASSTLLPIDVWLYDLHSTQKHSVAPATAQQFGIGEQNNTSTGADPYISGVAPEEAELYKAYWKTDKVTKFVLGSGCVHKHLMKIVYNKRMTMQLLVDSLAFYQQTYACMARVRGYPVHNKDLAASVTYSNVALDVVCSWRIKYRWSYEDKSTVRTYDTVPAFSAALQEGVNQYGSAGIIGDPTV